MWQRKLLKPIESVFIVGARCLSNTSALVTKIHRKQYLRTYPTMVVLSNGATFNIRYHEPRKIIQLPLDLSLLSEEEKAAIISKRKPKKRVKIQDDIDDTINVKKYINFIKK